MINKLILRVKNSRFLIILTKYRHFTSKYTLNLTPIPSAAYNVHYLGSFASRSPIVLIKIPTLYLSLVFSSLVFLSSSTNSTLLLVLPDGTARPLTTC